MADRSVLTYSEFNAVSHLTSETHLDDSLDIYHDYIRDKDYFLDRDSKKLISLREGFENLYDCIAYPCQHDNLTISEGREITKLLFEFGIVEDYSWAMWFLSKED